jgi:hypothetical protein
MSFNEIEDPIPLKEPADKTRMSRNLLKVQALFYLEYHLWKGLETEDSELPDNEFIELVLRYIGLEYIPKHTICVQNEATKGSIYGS